MKYTNPCCTFGEGDAGEVGVLTRKQLTGLERKTNSLARAYAILIMRFLFNGHKSAACTRMNLSLPSIIRSLFRSALRSRLFIELPCIAGLFTKSFCKTLTLIFCCASRGMRECGICAMHPSSRDLNCSG